MRTRLLIDKSSILGAFLHLKDEEYGTDVEHDDKSWHVPDPETCMERFQRSLEITLDTLDLEHKDIICVCDPGKPCKGRIKIFKEYKEKDTTAPKEFFIARRHLFDTANAWLKLQGAIIATPKKTQEADDLINELAIRLPSTIIWTRDKDLLACPTDVILQGTDGPEFNPEKFPVPDKYIPCFRTIVLGDSSDNLKSCNGFGPKTWDKMLETFGEDSIEYLDLLFKEKTLHTLKEDVPELNKLQLIIDQAAHLYKVYKCMQFIPVPAHEVKWEGGMTESTGVLVTRDNYDSIFEEIKAMNFNYSIIDYETDVPEESREWCKKNGIKVDVMGSEICGMGLRILDRNYYFSVDHCHTSNISLGDLEAILELIWGKRVYAHNFTGFEHPVTWNHFEAMLPNGFDTALMASYVDENDFTNLKHLSKRWLGYQQASYDDTLAGRAGMREVSGREVLNYGLDDVITTDHLQNLFTTIMQYEKTYEVFKQVEVPASYFTSQCFVNGVSFDAAVHKELQEKNEVNIELAWTKLNFKLLDIGWEGAEIKLLKGKNANTFNKLYELIHGENPKVSSLRGGMTQYPNSPVTKAFEDDIVNKLYQENWEPKAEFNVRSPKQVSKLLYENLKIRQRVTNMPTPLMRKANKPGTPATSELAIQNAIAHKDTEHVDLLKLLLKYKGYLTKESLFFSKYPGFVHWKTGKIHAALRQSNTTTRRFTCSSPNLQQAPKIKGKEIRDMIKCEDGWVILAVDFMGQELKIAADDSRDPAFVACYLGKNKKDVHALTGHGIAKKNGWVGSYKTFMEGVKAEDKIIDAFRTTGKKINFTCQYGAKALKVGLTLFISESEAQLYINARKEAFPILIERVKEWHKICRKKKYATTMLGARRHLHGRTHYGSVKTSLKEAADRLSYSMRIQGSAAEITKLVCGEIYTSGILDLEYVKPMFTVHDELLLYIQEDYLEEVLPQVVKIMRQPYANMIIPMDTEPEIGKSWGNLKLWEGS